MSSAATRLDDDDDNDDINNHQNKNHDRHGAMSDSETKYNVVVAHYHLDDDGHGEDTAINDGILRSSLSGVGDGHQSQQQPQLHISQNNNNQQFDYEQEPLHHHHDRHNQQLNNYTTAHNAASSSWKRWLVFLVLISSIIFVIVDSTVGNGIIKATLLSFLDWVEHHPFRGAVLVCFVYIIATVLFVPGSVLTLGAGYALGSAIPGPVGVLVATTAVFIGASIGSVCSFLLGRYLFRDCVMSLASNYPVFRAVDGALQENGLKIMILLRLSPLIPYNALDYMSGITAIPLRDYTLALFALLPGSLMLCFVGASASSLADSTSGTDTGASRTVKIITIVCGVVFGASGLFAVSYYSKKELDRVSRLALELGTQSRPCRHRFKTML
jgi:uncharacterized membrane protein YdjX (TVP38/TMEM64 family)